MSELSKQMITTFENIITIYRESANILNDVESLLDEKNYKCTHGNTTGTEQSKNINLPQKWITPYAAKYFINDNDPLKRYAIGIFFVDKSYTPINPLIICSSFNMKKDEDGEPMGYGYWYLKEAWFTLAEGNEMKITYNFQDCWNAKSGKVIAKELETIQGQQELTTIVDELMKL